MSAVLLEGKPLARQIEAEVAREASRLKTEGVAPCLAVALVGDDPASAVYVAGKEKACLRVGISSRTLRLPASVRLDQVISAVEELNGDPAVHGILVQMPLPAAIDSHAVMCALSPAKDVDGLAPENLGKLLLGSPYTVPCTPAGIVELLGHAKVNIEGAEVVIIGRSNIVGKPLAAMLMQKARGLNCTVTVCHSATRDIAGLAGRADLVVVAMGSPRFLKARMIKPGAIVVDVGISRVPDKGAERGYVLVGDADFDDLKEKASYITPVPGGVGPLTVAMLLRNTIKAARYLACRP
ncbi:MAG: bifunctional 5,10-methylenetetrahydrofolate dehydrogenase/5,10-methenyltetrahydrofolate cyclohydrolase [bacterium]